MTAGMYDAQVIPGLARLAEYILGLRRRQRFPAVLHEEVFCLHF